MRPRRQWLASAAMLAASPLLLSECGPWWARERGRARPLMGTNLAGPVYWNTELPFTDLMRMAGGWNFQRRDNGQAVKGVQPELDASGWLKHLPEGLVAVTPLAAGAHLPPGTWVVRFEGRGEIDLTGALRVTRREPGRLECALVALDPLPDPQLWLRVLASDPADPLRRIRVLKPGTESQAADDPWDRGFVARWRGWAALRFMDLMQTNNSGLARWGDRPLPQDRSFAAHGVAAEHLVELAQRCGAAPWFCMPHAADDEFVHRFAALVRDRLDPRMPIWIEYSNEVWNDQFKQAAYASQQGLARGLARQERFARYRFHAERSREIFRIWTAVMGGARPLVRVLSTQSGNTWATREILRSGAWREADVLGVGAYVGLTPSIDSRPSSAEVAAWPLERVFEQLFSELERQRGVHRLHQAWCLQHGLQLVAYEGGQHVVGLGEATRDVALLRLFTEANRDERMGLLYRGLFDLWEQVGGDLFCNFSSVAPPSRWGHWGLLEHHDDVPELRPKYRETLARMQRWRAAA
jgi:hypothetical protein